MRLVDRADQIEFSNIKITLTKACIFDAHIHRHCFKLTPQNDFFVGLFTNPRFLKDPVVALSTVGYRKSDSKNNSRFGNEN